MFNTLLTLCLTAAAILSPAAMAQSAVSIADTEQWPLLSAVNDRNYVIQVALPRGYAGSTTRYPTVYVLDANADFPFVVAISRRLQLEDDLAEFIVVGVAFERDARLHRRADYTPSAVENWQNSGGGPGFRRALVEEIVPFIERKYRADKGSRTLLGHSLGGLFASYMAMEQSDLFHNYVISSPSIWYDRYRLVAEARRIDKPIRVLISVGAEEGDHMQISHQRLSDHLQKNAVSLSKKQTILAGENHASAKFRAYADGLRWLFK